MGSGASAARPVTAAVPNTGDESGGFAKPESRPETAPQQVERGQDTALQCWINLSPKSAQNVLADSKIVLVFIKPC